MISQKLTSLLLVLALVGSLQANATDPKPRSIFRCDLKWFLIGTVVLGTVGGMAIRTKHWLDRTSITRLHNLPFNLNRYADWSDEEKFNALEDLSSAHMSPDVHKLLEWIEIYERNPKLREVAALLKEWGGNISAQSSYELHNAFLPGHRLPMLGEMPSEPEKIDAIKKLFILRKGQLDEEDRERLKHLGPATQRDSMNHIIEAAEILSRTAHLKGTETEWFQTALATIDENDKKYYPILENLYALGPANLQKDVAAAVRRMGPAVVQESLSSGRSITRVASAETTTRLLADAYRRHFSKIQSTLSRILVNKSTDENKLLRTLSMLREIGPTAVPLVKEIRAHALAGSFQVRVKALLALDQVDPDQLQDAEAVLSLLDAVTKAQPSDYIHGLGGLVDSIGTWPPAHQKKAVKTLSQFALSPDAKSPSARLPKLEAAKTLASIAPEAPETIDSAIAWIGQSALFEHLESLTTKDPAFKKQIGEGLLKRSKPTNAVAISVFFSRNLAGSQEHREFLNEPDRWKNEWAYQNAQEIKKFGIDPKKAFDSISDIVKKRREELGAWFSLANVSNDIALALVELDPTRQEARDLFVVYARRKIDWLKSPSCEPKDVDEFISILNKIPYDKTLAVELAKEIDPQSLYAGESMGGGGEWAGQLNNSLRLKEAFKKWRKGR